MRRFVMEAAPLKEEALTARNVALPQISRGIEVVEIEEVGVGFLWLRLGRRFIK